MTGGEFAAWQSRHGLRNAEMVVLIKKSDSTLKRWRAQRDQPIPGTAAQLIECIDQALARGVLPPSWPPRLAWQRWQNPLSGAEIVAAVHFDTARTG